MVELTISRVIKIIIGVFVMVVVVGGVYLFFKNSIIDFVKNLMGGEETPALILSILK